MNKPKSNIDPLFPNILKAHNEAVKTTKSKHCKCIPFDPYFDLEKQTMLCYKCKKQIK